MTTVNQSPESGPSDRNGRTRRRRRTYAAAFLVTSAFLVVATTTTGRNPQDAHGRTGNIRTNRLAPVWSFRHWVDPIPSPSGSLSVTEATANRLLEPPQEQSLRRHLQNTTSSSYYYSNNTNQSITVAQANSHSYSDYVGYHKRDIPSWSQPNNSSLTGSNAPLAGPVSYWKATRNKSNNDPDGVLLETTDLSDVFFYLALAVTWLVWLLKSFVKSDWLRYTQGSMLVRGHVLHVTRDEEGSNGIPTYKAVVDYFVGEDGENQIQIRKEFETQTHLEQGFGNVELLVLSDEPTSSVLKEDWKNKLEEMEEDYFQRNTMDTSDGCCWMIPNSWWKRVWVCFLAILVLCSLAGSMVAARFLPKHLRLLGWWIVFISTVCLIPVAIALRMALTLLERYFQVRNGIIVQRQQGRDQVLSSAGPASASTTQINPNNLLGGDMENRSAANSSANYCDPFAMLDTNPCNETAAFSLAHSRQIEMSATNVDETAGCYVIRMTPMAREHSNVSDVSSLSLKDAPPGTGLSSGSSSAAAAATAATTPTTAPTTMGPPSMQQRHWNPDMS